MGSMDTGRKNIVAAVAAARGRVTALMLFLVSGHVFAGLAPVEHYLKRPLFTSMTISPDGTYLAATESRGDDMTGLAVIDAESMEITARLAPGRQQHVDSFHWINDSRLLLTVASKEGSLAQPLPTGEIHAVNADGSGSRVLFGYQSGSGDASRLRREPEKSWAFPLHTMPDNGREVLIMVEPWASVDGGFREVRRLDTVGGRMTPVARSVLRQGSFLVDHDDNVRITWGDTATHVRQVHQRPTSGGEWQLLHDEAEAGFAITPLSFEAGGDSILVRRDHAQGSDGIYRLQLADGRMEPVYRHPDVDPAGYLAGPQSGQLYAVAVHSAQPELGLLVPEDTREARMARAVRAAFPGQHAYITSYTRDGKRALVFSHSDRNPGDFFLFDLESMRANHVASAREWMTDEQMGELRPIQLTARDGVALHGYLQLPPGVTDPRGLPLVVNPHGGPHGVRDYWGYDEEAQLLASRGYAVLKINFRGSGGYGAAFERAGHRQWGGVMQDDIADAVRWVIEQGYVDKDRICIYGASFGGYSALMSAARYPDIYKCTTGYVGVYDLELMYKDGDIRRSLYGRNYLEGVLGRGEALAGFSPVAYADRIKMPVFLIHGGKDERVPVSHANRMRSALRAAGNDPEWLVERNEGHGFYRTDNKVKLYTRLLAFLDRHIGPNAIRTEADGSADPGN